MQLDENLTIDTYIASYDLIITNQDTDWSSKQNTIMYLHEDIAIGQQSISIALAVVTVSCFFWHEFGFGSDNHQSRQRLVLKT